MSYSGKWHIDIEMRSMNHKQRSYAYTCSGDGPHTHVFVVEEAFLGRFGY